MVDRRVELILKGERSSGCGILAQSLSHSKEESQSTHGTHVSYRSTDRSAIYIYIYIYIYNVYIYIYIYNNNIYIYIYHIVYVCIIYIYMYIHIHTYLHTSVVSVFLFQSLVSS